MSRPRHKEDGEGLRYLKENVESPLSPEVSRLIDFLNEEDHRLKQNTEALRKLPGKTSEIRENELAISDIWRFQKLLHQHASNPNVKEVSEVMNAVYARMFGEAPPSGFEEKNFRERISEFLQKIRKRHVFGENLHDTYMAGREALDDTLDRAQTEHLLEQAATGRSDALFEAYVTSIDRYEELTDKILGLEKRQRDTNINVLFKTLDFYTWITSPDFGKHLQQEFSKTAKDVLDRQESQFKGVRGFIQRGIEAGADFAIDHLSGFIGDEDSFARMLFIKAAKLGKDLSKPVQYDPELIEALAKETEAQIREIAGVIDPQKIQNMRAACIELKANPDHLLSEDDRERFLRTFREFLPETIRFQEQLIALQGQLLQDAYILSHGENSEFKTDSTLRAKFFAHEGRDLIRLLQVYSPFGIFVPAEVKRKSGKAPVHIRSAYDQGWFKDHPTISVGVQGAELAALMTLAYGTVNVASKITVIGRILGSILGKPLKKIVPIAGQIYLGYEVATELNEYRISSQEREIFEILNEYNSFRDIPGSVREKIRQLTLRNEIEKRRKLFQGAGIDLSELGMGMFDRLAVGNLVSSGSIRDTMKATGALREAILAANRKLVLLNFEPFELL